MTRKHFNAIAATFRTQVEAARESSVTDPAWHAKVTTLKVTVWAMCDTLAQFNPNFDRSQFATACGF